jgi:Pectate lyase superfamily protein
MAIARRAPTGRSVVEGVLEAIVHGFLAALVGVLWISPALATTSGSGDARASMEEAGQAIPARSVTDFGAKCDGSTDDTGAIRAAAAAAQGRALYIPVGRVCVVSGGSITVTGALFSFPGGGTIKFPHDLGGNKAGIYVEGPWVENIKLIGPGGSKYPGVGIAPAKMDGLQIGVSANAAPQPFLRGLDIEGFHSAVVYNSNFGHIRLADSVLSDNYYGIYLLANAGDTKIYNSEIVGQAMAGIACPSNSHCLDGDCIVSGTHIGFAPYGIYQEPGASAGGGFISGCLFEEVHFESIGNAAIKSAAAANAQLGPSLDSTYIIHPGFSWDESHRYSLPRGITYAIDAPYITGQLRIDQGAFPLTPGSSGVLIHAQNCTGRVVLNYDGMPMPPKGSAASPSPLLVVDNPANQGCVWASRVRTSVLSPSGLTPYLGITVVPGQLAASTSFPTSTYAMSNKGIQPACSPEADPGSRWWVTVDGSNDQTTVTVHLSSPLAAAVSFYCHLTDQG